MLHARTLLCALVLLGGCSKSGAPEHKSSVLAVWPKGTTHVFWKAVEAALKPR